MPAKARTEAETPETMTTDSTASAPREQHDQPDDAMHQATAGMHQTMSGMSGGMYRTVSGLTGVVDPKRLLWIGGLAAVGVLGVVEWPVVATVGVGSYVAEQFAKSDVKKDLVDRFR